MEPWISIPLINLGRFPTESHQLRDFSTNRDLPLHFKAQIRGSRLYAPETGATSRQVNRLIQPIHSLSSFVLVCRTTNLLFEQPLSLWVQSGCAITIITNQVLFCGATASTIKWTRSLRKAHPNSVQYAS